MDISNHDVNVFPGDSVVVAKAGVVYVLGNVGHPAAFSIENRGRMTVLEVLALAGGTTANAKIGGARIIRKTPQGVQEVPIPLKEILSAKREDMELLPGDVLFIPTSEGKGGCAYSSELNHCGSGGACNNSTVISKSKFLMLAWCESSLAVSLLGRAEVWPCFG